MRKVNRSEKKIRDRITKFYQNFADNEERSLGRYKSMYLVAMLIFGLSLAIAIQYLRGSPGTPISAYSFGLMGGVSFCVAIYFGNMGRQWPVVKSLLDWSKIRAQDPEDE